MSKSALDRMFRNRSCAFTAIWLEDALERVVQVGFKIIQRRLLPRVLLKFWLEERGTPVIKGIIRTLDPRMSENIQGMERKIWEVYWNLRQDGVNVSIFTLLNQLNEHPPDTYHFL
jgi:hypothetical protein